MCETFFGGVGMKTIRDAEKDLFAKKMRVAHWERFRSVPDEEFLSDTDELDSVDYGEVMDD